MADIEELTQLFSKNFGLDQSATQTQEQLDALVGEEIKLRAEIQQNIKSMDLTQLRDNSKFNEILKKMDDAEEKANKLCDVIKQKAQVNFQLTNAKHQKKPDGFQELQEQERKLLVTSNELHQDLQHEGVYLTVTPEETVEQLQFQLNNWQRENEAALRKQNLVDGIIREKHSQPPPDLQEQLPSNANIHVERKLTYTNMQPLINLPGHLPQMSVMCYPDLVRLFQSMFENGHMVPTSVKFEQHIGLFEYPVFGIEDETDGALTLWEVVRNILNGENLPDKYTNTEESIQLRKSDTTSVFWMKWATVGYSMLAPPNTPSIENLVRQGVALLINELADKSRGVLHKIVEAIMASSTHRPQTYWLGQLQHIVETLLTLSLQYFRTEALGAMRQKPKPKATYVPHVGVPLENWNSNHHWNLPSCFPVVAVPPLKPTSTTTIEWKAALGLDIVDNAIKASHRDRMGFFFDKLAPHHSL